ncbi:MAG: hypothetical protein Q7W45_17215 [Bacteroidota bacterium]|nr:hypothetical protein [Bacteroidota bacterium]MDP3145244.1 hypothetical protein [Bacteroidota bacterium]MDP3556925.1 hypothetical protein [Bacteroidota bacterium]
MKKISILVLFLFSTLSFISQISSTDTIHWSAGRLLTLNDFKGDVIDSLNVGSVCVIEILASEKKGSRFSGTTTYVVTVFDWRNSWIKPKNESDMYLKYCQVMFDIGELYSRKLRKSIKEAKLDPYPVSFEEKYKAAKIGLADRIMHFQKESKYGAYNLAINSWAENIKTELSDLIAFKQETPKSSK